MTTTADKKNKRRGVEETVDNGLGGGIIHIDSRNNTYKAEWNKGKESVLERMRRDYVTRSKNQKPLPWGFRGRYDI